MKFICENCKAKYQIGDDKIAGRSVRMKCRRCGHLIQLSASVTETGAGDGPAHDVVDTSLVETGSSASLSVSALLGGAHPHEMSAQLREEPDEEATRAMTREQRAALGVREPHGAPATQQAPRAATPAPAPAARSGFGAPAAPTARAAAPFGAATPAPAAARPAGGAPLGAATPAPAAARPAGGAPLGGAALPRAGAPVVARPAGGAIRPAPSAGVAGAFQKTLAEGTAPSDAQKPASSAHVPHGEDWYVGVGGVPLGPVRLAVIREKALTGAVQPESLVWREGFDEWQPLKNFPELLEIVEEAQAARSGGRRPSAVPPAASGPRAPHAVSSPPSPSVPKPMGVTAPSPYQTKASAPAAPFQPKATAVGVGIPAVTLPAAAKPPLASSTAPGAPLGARPSPGVAHPPAATSHAPVAPVAHAPAPHTPAPHTPAPHAPAPHAPAPHTPAPHAPAPHTPAPHAPATHAVAPGAAARPPTGITPAPGPHSLPRAGAPVPAVGRSSAVPAEPVRPSNLPSRPSDVGASPGHGAFRVEAPGPHSSTAVSPLPAPAPVPSSPDLFGGVAPPAASPALDFAPPVAPAPAPTPLPIVDPLANAVAASAAALDVMRDPFAAPPSAVAVADVRAPSESLSRAPSDTAGRPSVASLDSAAAPPIAAPPPSEAPLSIAGLGGSRRRGGMHPLAYAFIAMAAAFGAVVAYMLFGRPPQIVYVPASGSPTGVAAPVTAGADTGAPPASVASQVADVPSGEPTSGQPRVVGGGSSGTGGGPKPTSSGTSAPLDTSGFGNQVVPPPVATPTATGPDPSLGTLSAGEIQGVVAANQARIRKRCWQQALDSAGANASPNARVSGKIVIGPSGSVDSATASGSEKDFPTLASCIAGQMKGWKFPPSGSSTPVNVPFVFAGQ